MRAIIRTYKLCVNVQYLWYSCLTHIVRMLSTNGAEGKLPMQMALCDRE